MGTFIVSTILCKVDHNLTSLPFQHLQWSTRPGDLTVFGFDAGAFPLALSGGQQRSRKVKRM